MPSVWQRADRFEQYASRTDGLGGHRGEPDTGDAPVIEVHCDGELGLHPPEGERIHREDVQRSGVQQEVLAGPGCAQAAIGRRGTNGGGHTDYHELMGRAGSWPVTEAKPDGPASLLRSSRDSFSFGYYAYSLFAVAGTWSILAVEAALRLKLGADRHVNVKHMVREAEGAGLLPRPGWDNGRLDAGRELRNRKENAHLIA